MRTLAGRIGPALLLVAVGCHHTPPRVEPTFSYYHAPGLEWEKVSRVLVLPLDNESSFNQVPEQVRRALASEFQQAGRFEVVPAPPDVWAAVSSQVRQNGRFNEAVMIELARAARADLIVVGTVSQYSPYRLPRLGLTLQVVSPADAVVVASVDGLWDSTRLDIAGRARAYYREAAKGGRSAPFPETLALESPQYFQRFVCHEAVAALLAVPRPPPPPPVVPVAGVDAGGKGAGKGGAGPVVPCATAKPCKTAPGCAGTPCAPNAAPAAPPLAGAPPRQMPKAPDEPKQDAPTVAAPMPDGPKLDVPPPDEPKPVAPMPDAPGRGPE